MAYAAVTSLMETLSLHFLQSQPCFPLEDLEAQIRDANKNIGLLQQILKDMAMKDVEEDLAMEDVEEDLWIEDVEEYLAMDDVEEDLWMEDVEEYASSNGNENPICIKACLPSLHGVKQSDCPKKKKMIKSEKLAESSSQNEKIANAWDSILLTSRLREVADVKQKTVSLHQNLGFLQESLEKSEIGYDNAGAMKDLEAEIRDVSLEAEERIEMELSSIYLAKDSLHITACLLRLHQIFIEAEKQTGYLKNGLMIRLAKAASSQNETITDDVSLLGWMRRRGLLLVKGLAHKKTIVSKFSKKASKLGSRMVGCHEVFMKILDKLTQKSTKGRQVISIVGMGGIGKTTLAHKLYEDPSVTSYFDKRAWVTVSQEYNLEKMLLCLIGCVIATSRDKLHEESTNQYHERLYKCLKGQRYLIVIDDIWNTTAWDSVQRCFPDDNNGSCILLTSRLKKVGKYASSSNSVINMPFLDADESWSLYCKVFGKIKFSSKLEQIGRDIVKKCEGLPLAITVVASLFSKTQEDEEKWKNVAKSVIGDSNDACSRILYLSYNQLPHHLKACFLYFGVFREDYEIPVKKLVRLWEAEGFFRVVKHVNMEKVAMECLQDLVDRSLVIVSKHSYNGEMKRIRIHDLLRDLCLREAKLENLLNANGVKKPCRWISRTSRPFYDEIFRFEEERFHKSRAHSFHLSHLHCSGLKRNEDLESLFSHLKLLRVVDMRSIFFNVYKALHVFANLVHLRYLALYTTETFDAKLLEHWYNMQTFIVSGDRVILYSSGHLEFGKCHY